MGSHVSALSKAERERVQVRRAWRAKTRALRELGGAIEAMALEVVQHAVEGRVAYATAELRAIEASIRPKLDDEGASVSE